MLRYLTKQYNIPRKFLPESIRYKATDEVLKFKGIVTHINYRKDGKWDIGEAFDWAKVINGVEAEKYTPVNPAPKSVEGFESVEEDEPDITSEEQLEPLLPEAIDPKLENEDYEELERSADEVIYSK